MLKTLALAGVAALSLAGAAAAQDMARSHEFVAKAGASDLFEITEGKLAQSRAHDSHLKHFGAEMVRDHTKSTMKIKAAVRRSMGHAPPPPSLSPDQERMVADLRGAHGRDFDRMFVEHQTQAHQMALDLMTNYAQNGDNPDLKQAATEIRPVVQMHLEMIQKMH